MIVACVQTPLYTGYMLNDWRASLNGPEHPTKYFISCLCHFIYRKKLLRLQRNQILNQEKFFFFLVGGGGGVQSDLENCAYLWKNPGYAPDLIGA